MKYIIMPILRILAFIVLAILVYGMVYPIGFIIICLKFLWDFKPINKEKFLEIWHGKEWEVERNYFYTQEKDIWKDKIVKRKAYKTLWDFVNNKYEYI